MSRFARVRAVLFDLDGTLIDSAPDLGAAADQMRVSRGLAPLPLASYRHMAGSGARGMLAVAFGFGTDHPEYDSLREEFFGHYEARMTQLTPLAQFTVPLGGQSIELQQITFEAGGRPLLRTRIREKSRFTIFDIDPLTAQAWGEALVAWAQAQPRG